MKTVTIRCEHTTNELRLQIAEENVSCIQCGLIQIILDREQADRVRAHCHCMPSQLYCENSQGKPVMTADPSQLDLGGQPISAWRIG